MRISPAVGTRKPAMMLSSVDLPQPRGTDDAKEFRGLDVEADARDARDLSGGRVVDEGDVADFDMGHDLRAAVIDGMRVCGQTRAIPPGRVSPESNWV